MRRGDMRFLLLLLHVCALILLVSQASGGSSYKPQSPLYDSRHDHPRRQLLQKRPVPRPIPPTPVPNKNCNNRRHRHCKR
ncbi:hypothetical protein ACHQM5_004290 [Ranunculus cassubicifolius]